MPTELCQSFPITTAAEWLAWPKQRWGRNHAFWIAGARTMAWHVWIMSIFATSFHNISHSIILHLYRQCEKDARSKGVADSFFSVSNALWLNALAGRPSPKNDMTQLYSKYFNFMSWVETRVETRTTFTVWSPCCPCVRQCICKLHSKLQPAEGTTRTCCLGWHASFFIIHPWLLSYLIENYGKEHIEAYQHKKLTKTKQDECKLIASTFNSSRTE